MAQADDTVWLPVLPSLKGFAPALAKGASSQSAAAGAVAGKSFSKAMLLGAAGVVAGVGAAGVALYKTGAIFNEVTETIRVGAGASGEALDGLVGVAKDIGSKVPASFEDIGSVVADVNTRLGLSGKTMETVATQYLEAGRILGEEVDINKTSAAFSAFKIEGDDVVGAMDQLFQVSQATGVGMNELASITSQNAPAMQALGFSFEETAGLAGTLDKAGLNSSKTMAGMSKALVELAKDGEDPQKAFKRVTEEMQGFVEKGDDAKALDLASDLFGTRNASQFIGALKSGKLNMEDLGSVAGMTDDTIIGLGKETMNFGEQWQVFKNKVLVWLEPLAAKVFGGMSAAMDVVNQSVTAFGAAWEYNDGEITSSGIPGFMEKLGYWAHQLFDYMNDTAIPALKNMGAWLSDNAKTIGIVSGIIGALMIPALVRWGVNAVIAGAKNVAAWAAARGGAIKTAAMYVIQSYKIIGTWVAMGLAAVKSGIETVAIWLMYRVESAKAAAAMVLSKVRIVGAWIAMSAAAVASGIKTAAVWTGTIIKQAAAGALAFVVSAAKVVGGWVLMGAQSLIQAARMAAAWFIALGPVGWVIAAIIGLAAVVIANWSKIKAWTVKIWTSVWGWIKDTWNKIVTGVVTKVTDLYNKIKYWFSVIKAVSLYVWTEIKNRVIGFAKALVDNVVTRFRNFKTNVTNIFTAVKNFFVNIWQNKIKPVFQAMGDFVVKDIPKAFRKGVGFIESAWKKVANVARKPINFVIGTVYNKGLKKAFNGIANKLGLPDKWRLPDAAEVPAFARGGWTGAGSKYQEAGVVHADEFVIRKESQRDIARKAPGLLDGLNRMGAKALGYAKGGLVKRPVGGRVTSGFGSSRGRYPHAGIDFAVPVGTAVKAALDGVVKKAGTNIVSGRTGKGMLLGHPGGRNTYYGHLSGFVKSVGDQVKRGMQIARSGNTGNSSGPHLHFETWSGGKPLNPARFLGGDTLPQGAEGAGDSGPSLLERLLSPITSFKDKMFDGLKAKFPGGSMMVEMGMGALRKGVGGVTEWIKGKGADLLGNLADTGGNLLSRFKSGVGLGSTKDDVRSVAGGYGWAKGAQWKALSNIISRESGWDKNAANPNSSARGLFQKMTSIHGAIEKTAGDQAGWGLNYIKGRYGDPVRAWDYWQRNHHYADGGQVAPYLHDNGGVLNPGLSQIVNKTRKPEAILTGSQWSDISKLALDKRAGGVSVSVVAPDKATAADYFDAAQFRLRQMERGGARV